MTYKSEKALEKSTRNSCVPCWRTFHQKEETGERWLRQSKTTRDTLQRLEEGQWSSLTLTSGSISPPPAICLLSTKKPLPMTKVIVPKQFKSNLSTLCRPAILHIKEQGIFSSSDHAPLQHLLHKALLGSCQQGPAWCWQELVLASSALDPGRLLSELAP